MNWMKRRRLVIWAAVSGITDTPPSCAFCFAASYRAPAQLQTGRRTCHHSWRWILEGIAPMPNGKPTVAFIGFGEAGQAIAAGLREAGVETLAAWDILLPEGCGEKLKAA